MNDLELSKAELDAYNRSQMDKETLALEERFACPDNLYHFTTVETAKLIIESMSLKYGNLKDMNDINESYRFMYADCSTGADWESIRLAEEEIRQYRQLSLSQDIIRTRLDSKTGERRTYREMAFAIDPMWGHYGDKGNGVCIVLDTGRILEAVAQNGGVCGAVGYSDLYNSDMIIKGHTAEEIRAEFHKNRKQYFFKKTAGWKYEQEFRILKRSEDESTEEYLPIKDAIVAVIMHSAKDLKPGEHCSASADYQSIENLLSGTGAKMLVYSLSLGKKQLMYKEHCIFELEMPEYRKNHRPKSTEE